MNVLSEIIMTGFISNILGIFNSAEMVLSLLVLTTIAYIKLCSGGWGLKKLDIIKLVRPLFMFLVFLVLYLIYFIIKIFFDR